MSLQASIDAMQAYYDPEDNFVIDALMEAYVEVLDAECADLEAARNAVVQILPPRLHGAAYKESSIFLMPAED